MMNQPAGKSSVPYLGGTYTRARRRVCSCGGDCQHPPKTLPGSYTYSVHKPLLSPRVNTELAKREKKGEKKGEERA